jgi:hypothetical protein
MNYLKSITTSVLNSTGVSFPFTIGERIPGIEAGSSIWELREAVKKVRPGLGPLLVQWHWRRLLLFSVNECDLRSADRLGRLGLAMERLTFHRTTGHHSPSSSLIRRSPLCNQGTRTARSCSNWLVTRSRSSALSGIPTCA